MNEQELRKAFKELGSADLHDAPSLRTMLDRPRTAHRPAVMVAKLAIAAGAIIALWLAWPRTRAAVPTTMSITEWRAPTDILLHTPGVEIVQTVPTLRSSVLEGVGLPLQ